MTVKQRLMLLIASAVIGLILVAGIGIYETERVFTAANFGNDNTVPALTALSKVSEGVYRARLRIMRHVAFATDPAKMAEIERTIEEAENIARAGLKEYEPTIADNEDRRRFDNVSSLVKDLLAGQAAVLDKSRANKKDEAKEMLVQLDAQGKKLTDAIIEYEGNRRTHPGRYKG